VKTLHGQAADHLKALKKFPEGSNPSLTVSLCIRGLMQESKNDCKNTIVDHVDDAQLS